MILLIVEGKSDKVFFSHAIAKVLQQAPALKIEATNGINDMLQRHLPNAIKLLQKDLYTKVIAVFDVDKMHEPYSNQKNRIERLKELVQAHNSIGVFPVRDNLENLIQECLSSNQRKDFQDRVSRQGKSTAVEWAIKQNLDQDRLKNRLTDLCRSLECHLKRDF